MGNKNWGRPITTNGLEAKIQYVVSLSKENPHTAPMAIEKLLAKYPHISLHYAAQLVYQHATRAGAIWLPATKKSKFPLTRQKREEERKKKKQRIAAQTDHDRKNTESVNELLKPVISDGF